MLGFYLSVGLANGVQNLLHPLLIIWINDNHSETVFVSLPAHAIGIVNMQVDAESWRVLRWKP